MAPVSSSSLVLDVPSEVVEDESLVGEEAREDGEYIKWCEVGPWGVSYGITVVGEGEGPGICEGVAGVFAVFAGDFVGIERMCEDKGVVGPRCLTVKDGVPGAEVGDERWLPLSGFMRVSCSMTKG
jgi:hypothetical protein